MQMRPTLGWSLRTAAALAVLLGVPAAGRAQIQVQVAGARTIVGVVRDSVGFALDSAEVYLTDLRRKTYTDVEGRFRFDDVKSGRHTVGARRIGFYPQTTQVTTGDKGVVVEFGLVPLRVVLRPIITSAARGGLSGVIGDTAYNVLEGADVWIVSTARRARSDSAGGFFIEAPPGQHMVKVSRQGYGTRLVSVSVPRDSGRQMLVWLSPASQAATSMEETAIKELSERLNRRMPAYSRIFTREDINRVGFQELQQIASAGAVRFVDETCMVSLAGTGGRKMAVWLLSAAELEAVEIYVAKRARYTASGASVRDPRLAMQRLPNAKDDCPTIIAWLRK